MKTNNIVFDLFKSLRIFLFLIELDQLIVVRRAPCYLKFFNKSKSKK